MSLPPPDPRLRAPARGTVANPSGRYEATAREPFDDGWDMPEEERRVKTEVALERPRSVISRNASPDIPFNISLNPYRGCEHGCIYCFARPSHAYLGLSPGLDFETKLTAKPSAPEVLAAELRKRGHVVEPLAIGTNTDPYQPIERDQRVMRGVLEVLRDFRHPVAITTKGAGIERDLDLLAPMAAQGLVKVGISVTTLDAALCRALEPRAPAPARRLEVIRRLSGAGVPVRVMVAPVIPVLTEHELEPILSAAREAGARAAAYILLRLPLEVSPLFRDWLERHRPDAAAHVMNRLSESRGGRDNDPRFGSRMKGEGVYAELLNKRFHIAVKRLGYEQSLPPLRCDLFRVPPKAGDQLSLF